MAYTIRTNIDPSSTSGTELADIVEEIGDLTQIVVESDTSNQPGGPSEGDAYIVNGDASWVNGSQYDVAVFRESTWVYHTPEEGWVAYIKDRGEARRFNGTDWNSRLPDSSPEHATDSGTDSYVSATNTDVPNDGDKIIRDFQSSNTTTTPTLDGKTITTKDGSALWDGALSGAHTFQYDSGTDTYLVVDPNPLNGDQPASVMYADDLVSDMVDAVTTSDSLTWHEAGGQSIASSSYATILDLTSASELVCGVIYGLSAGVRITIDGTVEVDLTSGVINAQDTGGSGFNVVDVPPCKAGSSLKVEAYNASGSSHEYGWRIATR